MGLKTSFVDILIKFITENEVMTKLMSSHNRNELRLLKPILQPSNDIVNGFLKKWMKVVLYMRWKLWTCHAIIKPMAKDQVSGLIIVKESKLLKPGWLA